MRTIINDAWDGISQPLINERVFTMPARLQVIKFMNMCRKRRCAIGGVLWAWHVRAYLRTLGTFLAIIPAAP